MKPVRDVVRAGRRSGSVLEALCSALWVIWYRSRLGPIYI